MQLKVIYLFEEVDSGGVLVVFKFIVVGGRGFVYCQVFFC